LAVKVEADVTDSQLRWLSRRIRMVVVVVAQVKVVNELLEFGLVTEHQADTKNDIVRDYPCRGK
jgi:hypothetical protein